MKLIIVTAALAAALALPVAAHAQSYPSKPVKLLVPFPAASATDIVARTVGQKLSDKWGQPVIVDNRPGAAGNIGSELAAKAPPDGYTVLMCTVANTISASLYPKLNYDFLKDFIPITLVTTTPLVLVANPSLPANNVKELIGLAKARPGELTFGSGGIGTSNHLAGELFNSMTGTKMVHVPYKGTPAAHSDLITGQVSLMFDNIVAVMPHLKSRRFKPIGVTSAKRAATLPAVPTIAEQGLPGFEAVSWIGASVPTDTPKELVGKLHADIVAALRLPDVRERLAASGADLVGSTQEQFAAFTRSEIAKWAKVVKASGARPE